MYKLCLLCFVLPYTQVNFNEPLSYIQRFTETSGNCHVLDNAAACSDTLEELANVAAFSVTSYTPTAFRTTKPFNPLLGETFDYDRTDDLGWRSFAEQVCLALKRNRKGRWCLYDIAMSLLLLFFSCRGRHPQD